MAFLVPLIRKKKASQHEIALALVLSGETDPQPAHYVVKFKTKKKVFEFKDVKIKVVDDNQICLVYTSPSPRDS